MDMLRQDVRYALRTLRRDLGFSAMVVLTLAIGIGLNTAVFSVVRSVLLAPLPYADSDRLVMLWTEIVDEGVREARSGFANVQDWRAQNRVFEDLAAYDPISVALTGGEWPEQIPALKATANLFSVLGVAPALGRVISPEDEAAAPVVVLSHALWQERFGGSPDAIGRTLEIAGTPFQVIGVMPEGFSFPASDTRLWLPRASFSTPGADLVQRGTGPWSVVGRLLPGVSLARAGREMNAIAARLEQAHPGDNAGLRIHAVSLHDQVTGSSFRLALWTLFGAVGLVLLIACANGAHMILARGMSRAHEFALRVSLGASTPRLIRQALTESMILSVAAGIAGLLLAVAGLRLLVAVAPGNIPRLDEIAVDRAVLAYATGVALAAGVLFGLAPALGLSRGPLADHLREGRSPSQRTAGHLARRLLIVFQFALAIILVFGASLLIQSLVRVGRVDPGFRHEGVLMANLSVEAEERRGPFYQQVVEEVRAIPGVEAAGIVEDLFVSGAPNRAIVLEGDAAREPGFAPLRIDAIAGEFFQTMGVPLREGRLFAETDRAETVPVAIVNEAMARRFWPGESPVGKRFRSVDGGGPWLEVVGVVADMRRQGPESDPIPQVFLPYDQAPSRNMILLVRGSGSAEGLTAPVRATIAAIDPTIPLYGVTTVEQALDRYVVQRRFQTVLLGLFSAIALLLAAVGIYGLIQYSVSQRTREIGVRMALGGTSGQVVRMVLRQGLTVAAQGLAVGIVCALLLSEALSALLFGVAGFDLANVAVTCGILLLTTIAACYIPARRAARVDPMAALRYR